MDALFAKLAGLPRIFLAPPTEAAGGAAPAAPAADDDGPPLVVDDPSIDKPAIGGAVGTDAPAEPLAPAPATPAPEAEAPEAPAPEAAAATAAPDRGLQQLQQDFATFARETRDAMTALQKSLTPAAPGTPAAPATPAAAAAAQAVDELEAMLADSYEVDVEKDPKKLAKAMLDMRKQVQEVLKLRGDLVDQVKQEAGRAAQQAIAQTEGQREFEALQRQHPGVDLVKLGKEARDAAIREGYGNLGDKALEFRAQQIWLERVSALKPASAAAPKPAAAAAPAAKPKAPAGITPGGASARVPTGGDPPSMPNADPFDEDAIDSRHSLVVDE
jgi:translation initiation factor IF-2